MSSVKRQIQRRRLATPPPEIKEYIKPGNPIQPAAKDQFLELREAAQNEADGEQ